MVSKASEDLPEPESPVMTTSLSRGISTSMFLRLCSRAPLTTILSIRAPHAHRAHGGALWYHALSTVFRQLDGEIEGTQKAFMTCPACAGDVIGDPVVG